MSFASIGGYSFVTKSGADPVPAAMVVEEITRDGVDSEAFRQVAKRAPRVTWTTEVDTSTPGSVFTGYQALQGTLVTVVGDDGTSYINVMVHSVQKVRTKKVLTPAGGVSAGNYILTAQWLLQGT